MRWFVDPGVRCDLVFYAAPNLSGKRSTLRVFPAGNRQGTDIDSEDLSSMVIRAPLGTRVVLCRGSGPEWEELPWRCIELQRGRIVPPAKATGLPGVRIPDLDLLDEPSAKRGSRDFQASYPRAERLQDVPDGAWSWGRPGSLKGRVTAIRIQRSSEVSQPVSDTEAMLLRLVRRVHGRAPEQSSALIDDIAATVEEGAEVAERLRKALADDQ